MLPVKITPLQGAAIALSQLSEPMARGIILVPTTPGRPVAMLDTPPGGIFPPEALATASEPFRGSTALLVIVNADGVHAAAADAQGIRLQLGTFDVPVTILADREHLATADDAGRTHRLGDLLAGLPTQVIAASSEVSIWAATRTPLFAPVVPAPAVVDAGHVMEQWLHCVCTGLIPDADLVALLATGADDPEVRDELLVAVLRLAYASLDESSSHGQAMSMLLGSTEMPDTKVLIRAGHVAVFAAAHTSGERHAAHLNALGALLLWDGGQLKTAAHAAEAALAGDGDSKFVRLVYCVAAKIDPAWLHA